MVEFEDMTDLNNVVCKFNLQAICQLDVYEFVYA